jgi:hypothetical protein
MVTVRRSYRGAPKPLAGLALVAPDVRAASEASTISILAPCHRKPMPSSAACENSMVVVCPSHAETIARDGWSKQHFKEYLYEKARKPVRLVKLGGLYGREVKRNFWPRWVNRDDDDEMVPLVRRASEITVVVAGGTGRHSAFLPGWATPSVTVAVE